MKKRRVSLRRHERGTWGKIWHFIWYDDSIWSWIANIVIAFILIKFIVYPFLGFTLGTSLPVVAVISESMEHDGSFDAWWQSKAICEGQQCTQQEYYTKIGISEEEFKTFSLRNGFNRGDVIVLKGESPDNIRVGDVIVFQSRKPYPIIHRVIKKQDYANTILFETKGDHNPYQIQTNQLNETAIYEGDVLGVASMRIPYVGFIKLWATDLTSWVF